MLRQAAYLYKSGDDSFASEHELSSHTRIGSDLADMLGIPFGGLLPTGVSASSAFLLPRDTLLQEEARRLGIRAETDFFGGVVAYPFMATKSLSHALISPDALAPEGWNPGFAKEVATCTLKGCTAFSAADALLSAASLLADGPLRIKRVRATGGQGQFVARNLAETQEALSAMDAAEVSACGVTVEENLEDVTTFSVGQVRLLGRVGSYWGVQELTRNALGVEVYGGSSLFMARGDFAALLECEMPREAQRAVEQAAAFDRAADAHLPGFFASRRNYDVAVGTRNGVRRSGVLEQSWRIGGATGAEIAAMRAMDAKASRRVVRVRTVERYGDAQVPPDAIVHFRGVDPAVGRMLKYVQVDSNADA